MRPRELKPMANRDSDSFLTPNAFQKIRERVRRETGISLGDDKRPLVVARMGKRLRALNLDGFEAYLAHLQVAPEENQHFINAITTNKTEFFRENHHFEFLDEFMPSVIKAVKRQGRRTVRIWSSACSTGEEPYSIALVVRKHFAGRNDVAVRILATDIDTNCLNAARAGAYSADAIAPVSPEQRKRHFARRGPDYVVKPAIKNMVVFRQLNLVNDPFPFRDPVDVIFCRNVMIYFDTETKRVLVQKFHRALSPVGWMLIGHSESLLQERSLFTVERFAVYRRCDASAATAA